MVTIMKGDTTMQQGKQTKKLPGFYIALCSCVIVIGIAGFFAQNYKDTGTTTAVNSAIQTQEPYYSASLFTEDEPYQDEPQSASAANTIIIEEADAPTEEAPESAEEAPESAEEVTESAEEVTEITEEYTIDNPDVMPVSAAAEAAENMVLSDPVPNMTVLYGFSGDTLMYNNALGDWRTHNGVDIEADIGSSVAAAAAGTVTEISEGSFGNTVTIEHENGYKTVYAQLKDICVSEGDTVTQAEVIGVIADSVGETTKQAHLHYEVYKDSEAVDPTQG